MVSFAQTTLSLVWCLWWVANGNDAWAGVRAGSAECPIVSWRMDGWDILASPPMEDLGHVLRRALVTTGPNSEHVFRTRKQDDFLLSV